jgi:TonB family protein
MRILAGCLFVAAGSALLTPSSQEFHNRYGEPDLERFIARPGIGLTIQYGSDNLACQVLIEAPQPLIYTENDAPLMSSEAVTEILEEVAPANMRGKETDKTITMSGCNEFQIVEYENVSITRSTHNCLPLKQEREMRATLVFKRDICPKQTTNSSSANSEKIYRAGKDGVSSPSCFYRPGPPSTKEAQAAKFEGFVIADVIVSATGRIENIRIVKSPGLGLDDSVRETLGKWRCQPAKFEGKAVPVKLEFEFSFLAP